MVEAGCIDLAALGQVPGRRLVTGNKAAAKRKFSDAAVIATAPLAARYLGGNLAMGFLLKRDLFLFVYTLSKCL